MFGFSAFWRRIEVALVPWSLKSFLAVVCRPHLLEPHEIAVFEEVGVIDDLETGSLDFLGEHLLAPSQMSHQVGGRFAVDARNRAG